MQPMRLVIVAGLLALGTACGNGEEPAAVEEKATAQAPEFDPMAARQRIESLQAEWVHAVADGDVDTIVGFYAGHAWFLPDGSPPLHGKDEIRAWWEETLADPPFQSLVFGPTEIRFSQAGDMAWDVGTSRSTVARDGEKHEQAGKYLVVWEKIDGDWKVIADAFNSD